jgi:type VI secretion system protein ImpF
MPARINPTLFDKLVADLDFDDVRDDPKVEGQVSRAATRRLYPILKIERFNEAALRATVLRELNWILNTTHLGAIQNLKPYPAVATSVLNYGVPDMAGKLLQRRAVENRAREIKQAIRRFEPRIAPQRLDVTATAKDAKPNAVTFVIRADVTSAVMALPVEFKTDVEIDTGSATLRE